MGERCNKRLLRAPRSLPSLSGTTNENESALRQLDDLYAHKHSIADGLYIKTADENYVIARWCCSYNLDTDFFWLAAHSLEKYIKAALLLNEQSAKEYIEGGKKKPFGHNIE
jgi:hypothetical protein